MWHQRKERGQRARRNAETRRRKKKEGKTHSCDYVLELPGRRKVRGPAAGELEKERKGGGEEKGKRKGMKHESETRRIASAVIIAHRTGDLPHALHPSSENEKILTQATAASTRTRRPDRSLRDSSLREGRRRRPPSSPSLLLLLPARCYHAPTLPVLRRSPRCPRSSSRTTAWLQRGSRRGEGSWRGCLTGRGRESLAAGETVVRRRCGL